MAPVASPVPVSLLPTIVSIKPAGGEAGETVTISGSRFIHASRVRFNGEEAHFTVINDNTLTAVIPAKATTGQISVNNLQGTSASLLFAVIRPLNGDLQQFLTERPILPAAGAQFALPTTTEKASLRLAIADFLAGKYGDATYWAHTAGYSGIHFTHTTGQRYYVLVERELPLTNKQGFFVFNAAPQREIVLEVPHPLLEANTSEQGIALFFLTQPRALLVAGTHPCNSCQESTFDGLTTECNGFCNLTGNQLHRLSDVAHHPGNLFHEAHSALVDLKPALTFFQLHGASDTSLGLDGGGQQFEAIVSYGVNDPTIPGSLIQQLELQLEAATFNTGIFPNDTSNLSGTTNLQGRYANGKSTLSCAPPACTASGKFLMVEQNAALRADANLLGNAIKALFP